MYFYINFSLFLKQEYVYKNETEWNEQCFVRFWGIDTEQKGLIFCYKLNHVRHTYE